MFVIEFVALITGLVYGRKSRIGQLFIFYILFDFLILTMDLYLTSLPNFKVKDRNQFSNYTNVLIALVELLVYYYFFFKTLAGRRIKTLMQILVFSYLLVVFIFFLTGFSFLTSRYSYVSNLLGTLEFVFLLPPCIVFFYELTNRESAIRLFERPSFWIVTGIFLFSFISIPYYLIDNYFIVNHLKNRRIVAAALYYMPLTFNFAFLIKAFLCKKTLTT